MSVRIGRSGQQIGEESWGTPGSEDLFSRKTLPSYHRRILPARDHGSGEGGRGQGNDFVDPETLTLLDPQVNQRTKLTPNSYILELDRLHGMCGQLRDASENAHEKSIADQLARFIEYEIDLAHEVHAQRSALLSC